MIFEGRLRPTQRVRVLNSRLASPDETFVFVGITNDGLIKLRDPHNAARVLWIANHKSVVPVEEGNASEEG